MTNECPDCKGRVPNATTIAAMEEARAIQRERRLQSLREAFEASATAWADDIDRSPHRDPAVYGFCPVPANADALFADVADWHKSSLPCFAPGTPWDNMVTAGAHYIIARDFGEFDRKRALMLWRLQNNN